MQLWIVTLWIVKGQNQQSLGDMVRSGYGQIKSLMTAFTHLLFTSLQINEAMIIDMGTLHGDARETVISRILIHCRLWTRGLRIKTMEASFP